MYADGTVKEHTGCLDGGTRTTAIFFSLFGAYTAAGWYFLGAAPDGGGGAHTPLTNEQGPTLRGRGCSVMQDGVAELFRHELQEGGREGGRALMDMANFDDVATVSER